MTAPRFVYPLQALERLYASRREQAQQALSEALREEALASRRVDAARAGMTRLFEAWRNGAQDGGRVQPERHLAARGALAQQERDLALAREVLARTRAATADCRVKLADMHVRCEALDAHKDTLHDEHRLLHERLAQAESDAMWLQRRGSS